MNGQGDLARFFIEGTNDMKSTIQLNQDDFDNQAKKLVVITSNEQSLILQSVESLKNQAEVLQSLLKSMGFDHYGYCSDSPRTVARLNLTIKQDDQS